jgi:hypothetical protein
VELFLDSDGPFNFDSRLGVRVYWYLYGSNWWSLVVWWRLRSVVLRMWLEVYLY